MKNLWLMFLPLIAAGACKEEECERSAECGAREQCIEGVCVDQGPGPGPGPNPDAATFPDARPDLGVLDADGGEDADAGGPVDADGGVPDADGGGPGDVGDGGSIASGLVWVMETNAPETGTDQRAIASFDFFTSNPIRQTFNAQDVMCTLSDWRAANATRMPIDGDSLNVTGFAALQLPMNPVELDRITPGRFDSGPIGAIYIFRDRGVTLTYRVRNGGIGQLAVAEGTGPAVTDFIITAPQNFPVPIGQPLLVTWNSPGFNPPRNIAVELADVDRNVVLKCTNPDTGMMMIPEAARQAFLAIATDPVLFEARHEEVGSMLIPINGTATMVQTELRATKGTRLSTRR